MNRLLYFMPSGKSFVYIPDSNYHNEPITKEESSILLGVFIVVNILLVILWLIELVRYLQYKKNVKNKRGWFTSFEITDFTEFCSVIVGIFWALIILFYLGYQVSKIL